MLQLLRCTISKTVTIKKQIKKWLKIELALARQTNSNLKEKFPEADKFSLKKYFFAFMCLFFYFKNNISSNTEQYQEKTYIFYSPLEETNISNFYMCFSCFLSMPVFILHKMTCGALYKNMVKLNILLCNFLVNIL